MKFWIFLFSFLMGVDVSISQFAISSGLANEWNPFPWAVPNFMLFSKLVGLSFILISWIFIMKQNKMARISSVSSCMIMNIVILWNFHEIFQGVIHG